MSLQASDLSHKLLQSQFLTSATVCTVERTMMEEETAAVELGNLHHHLVEEVFQRVPLKCLTRLKCVSKTWYNFITRHRTLIPAATSTGLVIALKKSTAAPIPLPTNQSSFLKLQDGRDCTLHASFRHYYPFLIDSCNGLLLYGTHCNDFWTYHICCPFLDHEVITLPTFHLVSRPACLSLSFDGFHYNDFRVFSFFTEEVDINSGLINFAIFSSQRWDWTEKPTRIINSYLLDEKGFIQGHCFSPMVYSKKRIYTLWSICMLVYDDEEGFFKLVRLPTRSSTMHNAYLSQLLWESETQIHFCDPIEEGFNIWTYISMDCNLVWRFKRLVVLSRTIEKFDGMKFLGQTMTRVKPCLFNEDLQVLYLLMPPGIIVSYSFETQRMARVWSLSEPAGDIEWEIHNVHPFLFNSLNWDDLKELCKRGESK